MIFCTPITLTLKPEIIDLIRTFAEGGCAADIWPTGHALLLRSVEHSGNDKALEQAVHWLGRVAQYPDDLLLNMLNTHMLLPVDGLLQATHPKRPCLTIEPIFGRRAPERTLQTVTVLLEAFDGFYTPGQRGYLIDDENNLMLRLTTHESGRALVSSSLIAFRGAARRLSVWTVDA